MHKLIRIIAMILFTNLFSLAAIAAPSCQIICYSHTPALGSGNITNGIYPQGQLSVAGRYFYGHCQPAGFEYKDISKEPAMTALCNQINTCKNNQCWAGGASGGDTIINPEPVVIIQPQVHESHDVILKMVGWLLHPFR